MDRSCPAAALVRATGHGGGGGLYGPQVGGNYRISLQQPGSAARTIIGVYRSIEPPRLLAFFWQWEQEGAGASGDDALAEVTEVTVRFSSHDDGTRVELRHELFPDKPTRQSHTEGWEGCFERLQEYAVAPDAEASA